MTRPSAERSLGQPEAAGLTLFCSWGRSAPRSVPPRVDGSVLRLSAVRSGWGAAALSVDAVRSRFVPIPMVVPTPFSYPSDGSYSPLSYLPPWLAPACLALPRALVLPAPVEGHLLRRRKRVLRRGPCRRDSMYPGAARRPVRRLAQSSFWFCWPGMAPARSVRWPLRKQLSLLAIRFRLPWSKFRSHPTPR